MWIGISQALSQFEFFSFVTILVFFFSFVTIWVFEFCNNLNYLSNCELSSLVTIWVVMIWVLSKFEFLSFDAIWVFEFCHNLSFSQFEFLNFITIWIFEFHHPFKLPNLAEMRYQHDWIWLSCCCLYFIQEL